MLLTFGWKVNNIAERRGRYCGAANHVSRCFGGLGSPWKHGRSDRKIWKSRQNLVYLQLRWAQI